MGTNTFHLLIAEYEKGKSVILLQDRVATKIGMGGINKGIITEAAIKRALDTINKFKDIINQYQVDQTLAFGTSALRNAANGPEVIKHIQQTGIDTKIISGDEEAQFIYFGIRSALDLNEEKSLIMDIGGGSVEFIIANKSEIFWKQSLEIGAQRLIEKFQPDDPISVDNIQNLDKYFDDALKPVFDQLTKLSPTILVGSSGTFDTLSEMYCAEENIPFKEADSEYPLTFISFFESYQKLISSTRAERLKLLGMIELRVDMIVVACCLIRYIIERHQFNDIRVSSYSLKEGVLASLAGN